MKTTLEAMIVPVDELPRDITLEADEKGSFLAAMQRCVGGRIEPMGFVFDDAPTVYCNEEGKLDPAANPPNRAIYATREMAEAGYASPADHGRPVREGEVIDIAFGDMLCVGFDAETGGSRDITPDERARVMRRFGSAASVASGLFEAMRIAYEVRTGQR